MQAHAFGSNRNAQGKLNIHTLDDLKDKERKPVIYVHNRDSYAKNAAQASLSLIKTLNAGACLGVGLFVGSALLETILSLSLILALSSTCTLNHSGIILAMVLATVILIEALLRLMMSLSITLSSANTN